MQCSGSQHPSSLPIEGAGRAQVSAPPTPWCHALVATGVACHQRPFMIDTSKEELFKSKIRYGSTMLT